MRRQREATIEAEVEGSDGDERLQRRWQRQQRRAQVLDSSSSESEEDDSVRSGRSGRISCSDTHSQSSTSVMGNLSGQLSESAFSRAMHAFDGIDDGENVEDAGGGSRVRDAETTDESTSDDDEEEDEEMMNPYVMNPFPNHQNARTMMLDYSAALLPPSMELVAISSKREERDSGAEQPLRPPSQPSLQPRFLEQQQGATSITLSPVRTMPKTALASFDPYGSPDGEALPARRLRARPSPYYEMEMEIEIEEESIEFTSNGKPKGHGLSVFGPLLDEPSSPSNQGQGPSLSPCPKHRSRQTWGDYGENNPLISAQVSNFSSESSARHNRGPQGGHGIMDAFVNVPKAVISTVVYLATTLFCGDQPTARSKNPFSGPRRLSMRMSNRQPWGMLLYFRVFAVSLATLFCIGTVTMMYHVSNIDDAGANVVSKRVLQRDTHIIQETEVSHRPSSIVLKRMGETKQKVKGRRGHWWNRNKSESSLSEGAKRPHTEVYHHGEQEAVVPQPTAHRVVPLPESSSSSTAKSSDASQNEAGGEGSNAAEILPVIVQTEEDGTMLIKLPPPKTANLQEPIMGNIEHTMGTARNQPVSPPGNDMRSTASDDEGTMYIKLPYPQQQHRRTLTEVETPSKRELEPPLRGAAMGDGKMTHYPPPPLMESQNHRHHTRVRTYHSHQEDHSLSVLNALRNDFDSWVSKHGKKYASGEEKEHRFHVWRKNHSRIQEKNQKHGPCRMTGKAVFGHNMFSDLDPDEFQSRFLTGYHGPRASMHKHNDHEYKEKDDSSHFREKTNVSHRKMSATKERPPPVKRHHSIQRKLEKHTAMYGEGSGGVHNSLLHGSKYQSNYLHGCSWWDVSCLLRWIFSYQYIGGTREPVYDENSYPSALDWRSMGVVTEVHSQGSCGACWAITAVETIESANAIATGELIDLAEEEVIACDGTCEMCNGGWPQNAYEYVMKHEGLPQKSSDYDADWLYTLTAVLAGESYEASEYDMGYYFAGTCPKGVREGEGEDGGSSRSQHSGDEGGNQNYDVSYVETTRYGQVKGYGYATDRCICYTDGSGCDCDEQDEKTAVLNVASYGPAAVCLEASLWQDYEGGIMTSDIGCSASFLDMNHCVEVVGYAFTDDSSDSDQEGGGGGNSGNSGSGSNDRSGSGSRDGQREGYWIVKNQWSNYWGMNGYAYVAMGENTCGILNDMTQVYMNN